MNGVIGVSFTAENLIKGLYENTFGGLAERLEGNPPAEARTAEDNFNRDWNRDYVAFIRLKPWYEYSFSSQLKQLWSLAPVAGSSWIRKWERRMVLSAEFVGKSIWGWVIEKAAKGSYGPEDETILVWAIGPAPSLGKTPEGVRILENLGSNHYLLSLPRYEPFTTLLPKLAASGFEFVEIAGNRNLLATWMVPETVEIPAHLGEPLTQWKVLTSPGKKRMALLTTTKDLGTSLRETPKTGAALDHLFDY